MTSMNEIGIGVCQKCGAYTVEADLCDDCSELIRATGSRHVCPGCGCDDTEEIEGAWNDWCNNCETHFYFENV